MKKFLLSTLLVVMLFPFKVKADEGMWFLMFIERLNHRDMQKQGLQLTSEEIYSINNNSLKDAIVQFGGGCTAEMVSGQGLVLTNHHCGYGAIAELSAPEHDYLKDGFWAKDKAAELKPKSLKVRFFVRMDDVSKRILGVVNDKMSELDREKAINQEIAKIEKENSENGKYVVSVRSFFQGNEYYYFVYQDYEDVRLVGTPPSSIGKYGGDTDNWEWPRHTGDFSMFRVYGDKDGNPAAYSTSNVPLQPKHHLPVSLKGYQPNDFAMILGYPGRTNRWMPAQGVAQNVEYAYPAWVEASKVTMDQMKKYMEQNQKVNIDYASKYAGVANYWKNRDGMIEALKLHGTVAKKTKEEEKFNKWAQKGANKAEYGDVVSNLNNYYAKTNLDARHNNYINILLRYSTLASAPYSIGKALENYAAANDAKRDEMRPKIQNAINAYYEKMYLPLEKDLLAAQLNLYASKASEAGLAPYVADLAKQNNKNFTAYVNDAVERSFFADQKQVENFLISPDVEVLKKDPLYVLSNALVERASKQTDEQAKLNDVYSKNFRLLVKGLRESKIGNILYPDANSTLRLTYGSIQNLPKSTNPKRQPDVASNYFTTLEGTVAKHIAGDEEFENPQRLLDLAKAKDYGQYGDKDGYLHVNFLSNNDITGGNSGSPVMNGKGELIGIAFDGNIEAMAGDVIFDPKLQRTISVDIRYVLWVVDKFAGAKHIVDEMTIVK
ncbi:MULTISPECIES: S46 family peptidase [Empedobacter]|mgnify:FL=1|uniref:Dipeptidyl-peptidase n=4 Tax=Empedobacter TaxID=59734 RepID=A0A376G4U4_9FLAO|nr:MULTISPECIES: S46 family peptidase [Empedobacter]MBW1618067.1 S46 family peptidase [Empedobacter falsenii]MDH0660241.1 S46 family peptidase [Empedobacter sp. GD03865]MDH0675098.1 S46 family peptidase [Empedobacter sp. GD03861]MDH1603860.1 S46 family peptidase [Empedobacter sp. GD03739]MDM1139594.1 S46 family peptidase [Empedobacter sp. R132-2]